MRCTDTCSRNIERDDFVAESFQVKLHLVEYQPVIPTNKAGNVFANNPPWRNLAYSAKHVGPQVTLVFSAFLLAGEAVGLAGESACNNVNCAMVFCKVCFSNVVQGIGLGKVVAQHLLAEWVPLAPGNGFPAHPTGGKAKASNSFK